MAAPVDTPTVVATTSETIARKLLIWSSDQVDVAIWGVERKMDDLRNTL